MTQKGSRAQRRREHRAAVSAASPSRRRSSLDPAALGIPFLLIAAGLYVYDNSLRGPFILDDLSSIPGNPSIRGLLSSLMSAPPDTTVGPRPIVSLSLAVNYALGGLHVWGYHAVNLAVHILAALALYGIVRRTLLGPGLRERYGDQAPWLALAVALIWVVHPLQTESVTYTVQRTELLMGLFFLLTLYCVIRGVASARAGVWYGAAVAASALGMGCKEVMVMAPLVVWAYDYLFVARSVRETLQRRWALYAGLAATWLIVVALVLTRTGPDVTRANRTFLLARNLVASDVTPWVYAKTQAGVVGHYLWLSFWPNPLVGDYDDWPLATALVPVLPAAVLLVTLLGATLWALRRRLPVAFLGVWFFVILAPTSSFYPLLTELAAERRMYLPLAAVITLVVVGGHGALRAAWRRQRWPADQLRLLEAAVLVAIVATLGHLTVRRNEDYKSAVSFWSHVVAKRPANARAHNHLGNYLFHQSRVDEALRHLSEAVRLRPYYAAAHNNLGIVLASQGKSEEAVAHYSEAIRLIPNYAAAHSNLGIVLASQGKTEEAVARYSEAIRLDPTYAAAYNNLGILLANQGKTEEAVARYSEAIRLDPDYAQAHNNLGVALAGQGRLKEAIAHYSEALRIAPTAGAHFNLGMALARDGKTQDAIVHLEAALRLDPSLQRARRALRDLAGHEASGSSTFK
jgi:protein O-mannosyl-transferase